MWLFTIEMQCVLCEIPALHVVCAWQIRRSMAVVIEASLKAETWWNAAGLSTRVEGDIEEARGPTRPHEMSTLGGQPTGLQMSLKFEPITLVFKDLRYSVPMPAARKPDARAKPNAKTAGQTQPTELQALSASPPSTLPKERLELLKVPPCMGGQALAVRLRKCICC